MSGGPGSNKNGAASSQTATSATAANSQTLETTVITQNAQATLNHSIQALQAMQASQAAARSTAFAGANNLGLDPSNPGQPLPNVPDGLTAGGLFPTGGLTPTSAGATTTSYQVPTSWTNVGHLSQTVTGSKYVDTVTQNKQQALLYWDSFNIGKNTTLNFDQSAGGANVNQWVAINEITDPTLRPSQILGSIQAPGQVYVINQNGIIFGGSSQVNVGALTASSLALNPAYINNGLLNDPGNNYQFQFSSLFTTTTALTGTRGHMVTTTTVAPLYTAPPTVASGAVQTVGSVPAGDVTVQAGARLSSPTNAENQGGRIALIAPNVINNGTISTPDGQTILAAGLQVGFSAHNADDPSLRGLDVFVGGVQAAATTLPTGTFTFNGLPGGGQLTFAGSGAVGTYTPAGGAAETIMGGTPVAIPAGSIVVAASGSPSFAMAQGGNATNGGDIEAPRADITLTGSAVNQLGIINSSTSVTLNGRIDLLANYNTAAETPSGVTSFSPFSTGTVEFGSQSLTQILPETSSSATTIGTQLAIPSLVNVQGGNIEMKSNSVLYAPGANHTSATSNAALDSVGESLTSGVTFNAGTWLAVGSTAGKETTVFANTSGSIDLDANSIIDVSGSENVNASVTENIVPVQLRGPELADSPVQRTGGLRGQTVYIDIRNAGVYDGEPWIGTPLGDLSGYVNDINRTVGELTTDGGSIALNAGVSVNTAPGEAINVSGGWVNYAGGLVQTTKVLANGQIMDISQATPNSGYQGIYNGFSTTSQKWGVTQTFINPLLAGPRYDAGYIQGGNGGEVLITAPAITIGGNLYGNTVAGPFQQASQSSLDTTFADASFLPTVLRESGVPNSSRIDLNFYQAQDSQLPKGYQTTSPNVVFQTDAYISQNAPTLDEVLLSQDIINYDGFGIVNIDTTASGTITLPGGVNLTSPFGGTLTFDAASIDIEGGISVPGGAGGGINLAVFDQPPTISVLATPARNPNRGQFVLGSEGSLSSTGLIVDNRAIVTSANALPLLTAGGNISIAGLDLDLKSGSKIDVSGGVAVDSSGKISYGNAGSISILGGVDPQFASLVSGGSLTVGSVLTGYSGSITGGGSLTIQSPLVQVGGGSLQNGDSSGAGFTPGIAGLTSNGTTLAINTAFGPAGDFFSQGGFQTFDLEGSGLVEKGGDGNYLFNAVGDPVISPAILITANTLIDPIVIKSAASLTSDNVILNPLSTAQTAALLPSEKPAVNLIFDAVGVVSSLPNDSSPVPVGAPGQFTGSQGAVLLARGDIVVQPGVKIETAPQVNASHGVSFLAPKGTIDLQGQVIAPGGTIALSGGSTSTIAGNSQLLFYEYNITQPFATVDLGPNSLLSAVGQVEQTPNSLGYFTGSVLPGGSVTVGGNIVAEQGATLDVSGSTGAFDEFNLALGHAGNSLAELAPIMTRVDSNAGSITFKAAQLLYSDATLLGDAGGPSAQGGTLTISSGVSDPRDDPAQVQPAATSDITFLVSQQGLNGGLSLPSGFGTLAGTSILGQSIPGSSSAVGATINSGVVGGGPGGEPVFSYFAANTNLFSSSVLDRSTANNGGRAGGFDALNLAGTVGFVGPVSISTARSISVAKSSGSLVGGATGGVVYADSAVTLTAPYVALNLDQTSFVPDGLAASAYPVATTGAGSLTINASSLADIGNLSLLNIGTLNFNSSDPVAGDIRGQGVLQAGGQVNLNAGQIYPSTEATFTIEAAGISISHPSGQSLPNLPLSAGGTLTLSANTIEQDGVLRAPFGIINLGTSSTQNIALGGGSITSVSGVDPNTGLGITVPYGIVDTSNNWYDPEGNNISLTGPPAKAINIAGENIDIAKGSTIDIRGGGDLFAYQFIPGTGGNRDILASAPNSGVSNSYAILPGYSPSYAAVGTYAENKNLVTDNVQDVGYFNAGLAVGEQVYLNASNGLSAGYYTLLPARYALVPGAFLVTATGGSALGPSVTQMDGSSVVSGYLTSGLNPTTSPVMSEFQVYSQTALLQRAPYTINSATTFFAANAASNNAAVPRLPIDSGQLVLNAGQSLILQGSLQAAPPVGGLGSEVDIASPEEIDITGPNSIANAGALALDSSQLTEFGAASLLIGGYRTTTSTGTSVTVTTDKIVVDNAGSTSTVDGVTVSGLAAPDLILVSTGTINVSSGSIEQLGPLSGSAQTLSVLGNGALLRLSNDPSAQISRSGTTAGDTTSLLTIGDGVRISNATGAAAGSLTLDSTALVQISQSLSNPPVLLAKRVALDSEQIDLEVSTPSVAPTSGLILTPTLLSSLLASTQSLSLNSYSSIGLYGSGQIGGTGVSSTGATTYQEANLSLHADDIYYADTENSSGIIINAQTVSLDNLSGGAVLPSLTGLGSASLTINARTVELGSDFNENSVPALPVGPAYNTMQLDNFSGVTLNASSAILLRGLGAEPQGIDNQPVPSKLVVGGNLSLIAPLITSASATDQAAVPMPSSTQVATTSNIDEAITAAGTLIIEDASSASAIAPSSGQLAASLALTGSSVTQQSGSIVLHSGNLSLTGTTGDLAINGTLDVSGVALSFYTLNKFTSGGQISLNSTDGNVVVNGLVNVSGASGTGTDDSIAANGGSVSINANGYFVGGQIQGAAGVVTQAISGDVVDSGAGGTFTLNAGTLSATAPGDVDLSALESGLSGFTTQSIRDRNDSSVTIDGTVAASNFNLSADAGSIIVAGEVNASGLQGGTIGLEAGGSIITQAGSLLDVHATELNDAGQGGTVTIAAGSYEGAPLGNSASIQLDGAINLAVNGRPGGTLNLRAPQVSGGAYTNGGTYTPVAVNATNGAPSDVAIASLDPSLIENASSVVVEGFYVQDALTPGSAPIDPDEIAAMNNALAFTGNSAAITSRIFGSSPADVHIRPGEEIDNSLGSLELQGSWDLSSLRYGAPLLVDGSQVTNAAGNTVLSEPGVLTIRAAGDLNIDFQASLNDGFDGSAGVNDQNVLMPVGSQSWSYNLTAGAAFGASSADVQTPAQVLVAGYLNGSSLILGEQTGLSPVVLSQTSTNDPATFFQTIRTGTGNISINSGGDVLLVNNLATIYTAGSQVDGSADGDFTPPAGLNNGTLLPATYSTGGGNVSISAQGNIAHEGYSVQNSLLTLVPDSSAELPTNWLDREGAVTNGQISVPTTWWVDFTNYFEGVGALGGGNVTLNAGDSVVNLDASVPTNAREIGTSLTKLGGGDLTLHAGNSIDGGVYYIESGNGIISAGGDIATNATRTAVSLGHASNSIDELPTTYFLGQGNLSISAGGETLLGPVANPFLLPQSYNNISAPVNNEISYFSTYSPTDEVNVSSLVGNVTIRDFAGQAGQGSLFAWYNNVLDANPTSPSLGTEISAAEPWLLLAEATISSHISAYFGRDGSPALGSPANAFGGLTALMPSTLRVTSYSGDIDLVGTLTLAPSSLGSLDLLAGGAINALQVNAIDSNTGTDISSWGTGVINLSDADPSSLPSAIAPISSGALLSTLDPLFDVTGASQGLTQQVKQDLHADVNGAPLHAGDPNPVYVVAGGGNISGLNLYTAKQTYVLAKQDITDVGLYLQNTSPNDISIVSAGRDIVAYDASSILRQEAGSNLFAYDPIAAPIGGGIGAPNAGDIQIAGPGALEVLTSRNLTLGNDAGENPNKNATIDDGLFSGLTSVGAAANLSLPASGANLVAVAGLGGAAPAAGLNQTSGSLDFSGFTSQFLNPSGAPGDTYLTDLSLQIGSNASTGQQLYNAFEKLSRGQQDLIALDAFYLVLRDAGRDHNDPDSANFGTYSAGYGAIAALLPSHTYQGDVNLTSREIKTASGGDINVLAPGGQVEVGVNGNSAFAVDQGIITVAGGNISVFTSGDVSVGTSRIFTLDGGNEIIWSTDGNIAAGASSKTVVSAPPTRVIIDPTSGSVQTDLAGLSTGGGIGVLQSVATAATSDVDLIAPNGTIDAGDAGIRASGNLNISALKVLNADNISVGGKSSGVPTATSVNLGAATAASSAAGSATAAASNTSPNNRHEVADSTQDLPSIITVEVVGYGGGDQD